MLLAVVEVRPRCIRKPAPTNDPHRFEWLVDGIRSQGMEKFDAIFADSTSRHATEPQVLRGYLRPGHVLLMGADSPYKQALHWNLIVQDIEAGAGVAVIDTTGSFGPELLNQVPAHRLQETWWFAPANSYRSFGLNPLAGVAPDARSRAAQELVELFSAIWDLSHERTPLLIDLMRFTVRVLLDRKHVSMLAMYRFLTDTEFRRRSVSRCQDPLTRMFWRNFDQLSKRDQRDKVQSVLTRLHAFLGDPILRHSLAQPNARFDIPRLVRDGQVLVADVSRRTLGHETAVLFSCLLIFRLQLAMQSARAKVPFFFHLIGSAHLPQRIVARLLSSAYGQHGVVVECDQIGGEPASVRSGLLHAGVIICSRVGADDVRYLAPRFTVANIETELQATEPDQFLTTLSSYPLKGLAPHNAGVDRGQEIVVRSERMLSVSQQEISQKVRRFFEPQQDSKAKVKQTDNLEAIWS